MTPKAFALTRHVATLVNLMSAPTFDQLYWNKPPARGVDGEQQAHPH
jgi:hypothetical protein